ncbi:putative signal transducing protein [Pseudotenacibaculum haliotis]|uniref:DUF2007 domain-containing protein n=1 Tax=Pseudotenacibaculum haliotis TaxID=1862138 RepID=A0ABW5LQN7_9FLAO
MNNDYIILTVFEYSTEAHVVKSKLESEGIRTMLMDEKTIDSDPLLSQAIGGVKLLVHKEDLDKAMQIYNTVRKYEKDEEGNDLYCPSCNSNQILVAPLRRRNIFFMLFPFFERRRYICNTCKTIF